MITVPGSTTQHAEMTIGSGCLVLRVGDLITTRYQVPGTMVPGTSTYYFFS